jgi:hypothetical protein
VWRFIRISFERPKYSVSRVRFSKVQNVMTSNMNSTY